MNRTKMIKDILGEAASKLGFAYRGSDRIGYRTVYAFRRTSDNMDETTLDIDIVVMKSLKGGWDISLGFYGTGDIIATRLIEGDFKEGHDKDFLRYENEEELRQILLHFKKIIEEKAEENLKKIARAPEENRADRERQWKLYQEHEELNQIYRERYGMGEAEPTVNIIRKIGDLILEKKDEEMGEVGDLLVGLAAVYGSQFIEKCGGEWVWDANNKSCYIKRADDGPHFTLLNTLIWYWQRKRQHYNGLLSGFLQYSGKIVGKVLNEPAKKLGFPYYQNARKNYYPAFSFDRKKGLSGPFDQSIIVQTLEDDEIGWNIRMLFVGKKEVDATRLIEGDFKEGSIASSYWYADDGELERILCHFRKIMERRAKEIFREL